MERRVAPSESASRVSTFAIAGRPTSDTLARLVEELRGVLSRAGFSSIDDAPSADLVVNVVDGTDPDGIRPVRRKARGTYVAALHELPEPADDMLAANYPLLVRALSNIVLCYVPGHGVWFTTMERGNYRVGEDPGDVRALAREVLDRLVPLARSKLVIENEFRTDLEPELWDGDEITESLKEAGRRLGELDLLPNPFPLEDILDERDLRHIKRLYGIGGLSYGNLSARKDENRFWMSASGVDKSKLETPGRDILLVSGYDPEHAKMILSVPPGVEPRRVSVDAIEHWMIYQEHPDVGAIVHVHAWVEGIHATEINYPCGTEELARSVAECVAEAPDPANAIVGLRNHGITVTGPSLKEILDRIVPQVVREIPMY